MTVPHARARRAPSTLCLAVLCSVGCSQADAEDNGPQGKLLADDPHGYVQQRPRLWADYRPSPYVRLFGELADSRVPGLQTRPVRGRVYLYIAPFLPPRL